MLKGCGTLNRRPVGGNDLCNGPHREVLRRIGPPPLHRQSSAAQLINDSRSPDFGRYLGPYLLACVEEEGKMADLSRRDFIRRGSIGVAAGVAAVGIGADAAMAGRVPRGKEPSADTAASTAGEPIVAYVRRGSRGEVGGPARTHQASRRRPDSAGSTRATGSRLPIVEPRKATSRCG
jgi:hypothetical protein